MILIAVTIFLITLSVVILHTIIGCILVPLRGSLFIDGIGHSVVFGIISGFLIGKNLNSIWLFIGAVFSSILMNFLIIIFNKKKEINYDSSVGLSFSFLFSIGILLISIYAKNIHLDLDMILLGNVEYAIYDTVNFLNLIILPKIFLISLFLILIFLISISLFFKEIIFILFDKEYSKIKGINIFLIETIISIFSSYVIVTSFNIMGALILVGIATAPFGFIWKSSKNFFDFLYKSILINSFFSFIAIIFSLKYNLPISATVSLFLTFFSILNLIIKFIY